MNWRPLKYYCDGPPQYGLNVSADHYAADGFRLIRTTDICDDGTLAPDDYAVFVAQESVEPRHMLREGDLLFSRSGSLGRCFRVREHVDHLTFAGYLVRFRPRRDAEPRFLEYCALASYFQSAIEADAVTSTISNFNAERYANLRVPDLPIARQRAIANLLDGETARIDALIDKKHQLVQRLEERWRSLVRHSMQKAGRTSGWIPLKRLVVCLDGRRVPLSAEERAFRQGDIPYYGASGVIDFVDEFLFNEELVLLGEDGAQLGDPDYEISFVVNGKCWVNNHAHVLRPSNSDPQFLALHLSCMDRGRLISGSTREKLTQDDMKAAPVPNLELEEQRVLGLELARHREACRSVITDLKQQVDLLREHRQALITAAVTGELEVPGVAA